MRTVHFFNVIDSLVCHSDRKPIGLQLSQQLMMILRSFRKEGKILISISKITFNGQLNWKLLLSILSVCANKISL